MEGQEGDGIWAGPIGFREAKTISLEEEALQVGKREKEGLWEKVVFASEVTEKIPCCGNPGEFPSGQMLQHSAGSFQLLRVGGDLSGLEGVIYEIKLKSNIDHLIFFRSSAEYFS